MPEITRKPPKARLRGPEQTRFPSIHREATLPSLWLWTCSLQTRETSSCSYWSPHVVAHSCSSSSKATQLWNQAAPRASAVPHWAQRKPWVFSMTSVQSSSTAWIQTTCNLESVLTPSAQCKTILKSPGVPWWGSLCYSGWPCLWEGCYFHFSPQEQVSNTMSSIGPTLLFQEPLIRSWTTTERLKRSSLWRRLICLEDSRKNF